MCYMVISDKVIFKNCVVGIVRLRTKGHGVCLFVVCKTTFNQQEARQELVEMFCYVYSFSLFLCNSCVSKVCKCGGSASPSLSLCCGSVCTDYCILLQCVSLGHVMYGGRREGCVTLWVVLGKCNGCCLGFYYCGGWVCFYYETECRVMYGSTDWFSGEFVVFIDNTVIL
jgi:hypothetical protein